MAKEGREGLRFKMEEGSADCTGSDAPQLLERQSYCPRRIRFLVAGVS